MNRIVLAAALLLSAAGNNPATASPATAQGSGKDDAASSGRAEKNAPVKTLACEWESADGSGDAGLAEENAVRLALYEVVASGRGLVKARKDCATIEGDPAPVYATAKGGRIKITHDYSRDRWLTVPRPLKFFARNSYTTRKVEIGYLDQGKFIPLSGAAPEGRRLLLRLRGKEYF